MKTWTIANRLLSLSIDAKGRVVALKNRLTGTELIAHPGAAEAWRMIVPTGRHTVDIISGSEQTPERIQRVREDGRQRIVISYDKVKGKRVLRLVAEFIFELEDDGRTLSAWVEIRNRSARAIDEVEFPVIGGLGGFPQKGKRRVMHLVTGHDQGTFHGDVLNSGLPVTGRECDQFVREHETAMFEPPGGIRGGGNSIWLDLHGKRQGLYLGYHCREPRTFAFKVERYPKGVPNAPVHHYPQRTPRWLRVWALHVPRLRPHRAWTSGRVTLMPHEGDWHQGADLYAASRHEDLKLSCPPSWMDDFVGWTEILGKTYLGEVFHDFGTCARAVLKDRRVTGLNLLFLYGHTSIGAEGADFDQAPSPDLGGERAFRRMLDGLHRARVRVILLDHLHRWVNRDVPQYDELGLERYAVLDETGRPRTARWWKETFLSCRRLEGPTPEWVEMCPASKEWLGHYLEHVAAMIARGVDGLELDTFFPSRCYSPDHGHAIGADTFKAKMRFMRRVREHAKRLNPDFLLLGETMVPEVREVLDGFYPNRYPDENGRIFRYLFPEITQQAVRVGNYAYDAVNKALSLGIGVETEIWGLRKTTLAGCPELAAYIGEVNRFKRKHAEILIRGRFRDTVGARVVGDCLYAVLEGPDRTRALVLRNPHDRSVRLRASLQRAGNLTLSLWRPFASERTVRSLPLRLTLKPYEAAVLLAL